MRVYIVANICATAVENNTFLPQQGLLLMYLKVVNLKPQYEYLHISTTRNHKTCEE